MPVALIYLGAVGLLTVVGLGGFAYQTVRESAGSDAEEMLHTRGLALLLAQRRNQYASVALGNRTETGFITYVCPDANILFLDTRRAELTPTGELRPVGSLPAPTDWVAVPIADITKVEAHILREGTDFGATELPDPLEEEAGD